MEGKLTVYARELREHSTDAERIFWSRVRDRRLDGFKFKRQIAKRHYIVDFICREAHLIVEIDGGQHAANTADVVRDRLLRRDGYRVLRFWNNELQTNIDGVIETVLRVLKERSAIPPSP
jgi:very-short-patch-repair endonuclease